MNRSDFRAAVRRYTRDSKSTIYIDADLNAWISEAIYRLASIEALNSMVVLTDDVTQLGYLPTRYHYLVGLYAAARAFSQDEQHYQATSFMNEFEYKMNELVQEIQNGTVIIVDGSGDPVELASDTNIEYVINAYFAENEAADIDDGVDE